MLFVQAEVCIRAAHYCLEFRRVLFRSARHRYMSIVAAELIFLCTPTLVADGDGPVWCAEGPRIRIAGIAARELDGTCRRGHPCPRAEPIDRKSTRLNSSH